VYYSINFLLHAETGQTLDMKIFARLESE